MSANRFVATKEPRFNGSVRRSKKQLVSRANTVLAERNQAVVAVGAWVESGQDFQEHPSALALLTEEIQAEKRRTNEETLHRFQDEVRHRVAQQAQVRKMMQQPTMKVDRRDPLQRYQDWTHQGSAGEKPVSTRGPAERSVMERGFHKSSGDTRQVRLRLAACRIHEEMNSDFPVGRWNVSPSRHKTGSHVLKAEQDVEEEEEEDDHLLTSHHDCPLVQQKFSGSVLWESDKSQLEPGFQSDLSLPRLLWPLPDPEEERRQRQSEFLMHRRLCMISEREQVKENKQHRKHLKRTARIKAEKEQIRLEEERRLERLRQLAETRQKLEERELLIQGCLKLEEEERAAELQRRKNEEKAKSAARYVEALRAQMKQRLSQEKLQLPPLCYCAASFWDSHPDTCANNCVFHDNPKEYAKALHSTMMSFDLQ